MTFFFPCVDSDVVLRSSVLMQKGSIVECIVIRFYFLVNYTFSKILFLLRYYRYTKTEMAGAQLFQVDFFRTGFKDLCGGYEKRRLSLEQTRAENEIAIAIYVSDFFEIYPRTCIVF